MYTILKQHPDIFLPEEKELMFFTHHYDKGIEWYKMFFESIKNESCAGDISPPYLISPSAASRIHKDYPNAKIIVTLRNPPDQVNSMYHLWITRNRINQDIRTAIQEKKHLLDSVLYYKHLSRYLEFFDKSKILILFYEDLKKDPKNYLRQIYRFLGVEEFYPKNLNQKQNQYREPYSRHIEKLLSGTGDLLRRLHLLRFKILLNRTGISNVIKKLNTRPQEIYDLPEEARALINTYVKDDKLALENLTGRHLDFWK